jgi:hypothetical protein
MSVGASNGMARAGTRACLPAACRVPARRLTTTQDGSDKCET